MADSTPNSSSSSSSSHPNSKTKSFLWPFGFLLTVLLPVIASVLLYQLDSFDPAPFPMHELTRQTITVPRRNGQILKGAEKIGVGRLSGPEDVEYDPKSGVIYTGCLDGWIKRVKVNELGGESVVEEWVNTGGRPLGLALGHQGELIIGDADKGLLKVSENGVIELLTDSAEGQKFKLTDGVDIADDGMIYFTDASYKYSFKDFAMDSYEGRPYGRFLSYDPSTKQTKILVRDLYFANGVAVSPDQNSVIFCETPMRRCKRHYIHGERKGSTEIFFDNIPGLPDNIRYDGDGHYWIALPMESTSVWYYAQKYPFIRKILGILTKYVGRPDIEKNSGAIAVDLAGKPTEIYQDPALSMITSAVKIGDHLFAGSVANPYILRLNLTRYPAVAST